MFWIIIAFIVSIGLIVFAIKEIVDYGDYEVCIFNFFLIPMVFLLSILISLLMSEAITSDSNIDYKLIETTKICALKDNITGEGSRYLFSGYYEEELCYFYCEETTLGYKTEKIEADCTFVKYSDDENYRIEEYEPYFTSNIAKFFGVIPSASNRYIIYCPDEIIEMKYDIDLE